MKDNKGFKALSDLDFVISFASYFKMVQVAGNESTHEIKVKVSSPNATLDEFMRGILERNGGHFAADYSNCQFMFTNEE